MKNSISSDQRPMATFQIDMDGLRIPLAAFGYNLNGADTAIYSQAATRFLELFEAHGVRATFYCIGEDALVDTNRQWMAALARGGHEVGNHSLSHDWRYAEGTLEEKTQQIKESHHLLEEAAGVAIEGFKGPGYFIDASILSTLMQLQYTYDSSILPSPYGGLMIKFGVKVLSGNKNSDWRGGDLRLSSKIGGIRLGLGPQRPYFPDTKRPWIAGLQRTLCEIPVSVLPGLRVPLHSSYLFPLHSLGLPYFKMCASLVRCLKLPLVFVMHGIDLLSETVESRLSKHSTLTVPVKERIEMIERIIVWVKERFEIVTTLELAQYFHENEQWSLNHSEITKNQVKP